MTSNNPQDFLVCYKKAVEVVLLTKDDSPHESSVQNSLFCADVS